MNCKITHTKYDIQFVFDKKQDDTRTVASYSKSTSTMAFREDNDYYGQGYTVTPKEVRYVLRYLEKGGFIKGDNSVTK